MASATMSLKGVPSRVSTVSRQASVIHRQLTAGLVGQRLQTQRATSHSTVGKGHVCGVCCSHHAQGRVCAAAAATTTKNVEEFTDANKRFRDIFSHGHLPAPPRRKVAIVTCMDARIHPEKVLGLAIGDAHVIRNAGGRVSGDALRSLVISQRALGTEEVIVIHHTKCGMQGASNDLFYEKVEEALGPEAKAEVEGKEFLAFPDLQTSLRTDVNIVKSFSAIPNNIPVSGFIYDVETGGLEQVA